MTAKSRRLKAAQRERSLGRRKEKPSTNTNSIEEVVAPTDRDVPQQERKN